MPLFKYQAATGIIGSASLPLAVVSGSATQSTPYSDGDITLTLPSVYGLMGAECVVDVPMLAVVGRGQDSIDGAFDIHMVIVDGGMQLVGGVTLPSVDVYGQVDVIGVIDSSFALPLARMSGDIVVGTVVFGGVIIPSTMVYGEIVGGVVAIGGATIPTIGVSGDMRADGAATIPAVVVSGIAGVVDTVSGAVRLPSLLVSGEAIDSAFVMGSMSVPRMSVSGSLTVPRVVAMNGSIRVTSVSVFGVMASVSRKDAGVDDVLNYVEDRRFI